VKRAAEGGKKPKKEAQTLLHWEKKKEKNGHKKKKHKGGGKGKGKLTIKPQTEKGGGGGEGKNPGNTHPVCMRRANGGTMYYHLPYREVPKKMKGRRNSLLQVYRNVAGEGKKKKSKREEERVIGPQVRQGEREERGEGTQKRKKKRSRAKWTSASSLTIRDEKQNGVRAINMPWNRPHKAKQRGGGGEKGGERKSSRQKSASSVK